MVPETFVINDTTATGIHFWRIIG